MLFIDKPRTQTPPSLSDAPPLLTKGLEEFELRLARVKEIAFFKGLPDFHSTLEAIHIASKEANDEELQEAQHRLDRLIVGEVAQKSLEELQEGKGIRLSRKKGFRQILPGQVLSNTYYAHWQDGEICLSRYIHADDPTPKKGLLPDAGKQAQIYSLLDAEGKRSLCRRKTCLDPEEAHLQELRNLARWKMGAPLLQGSTVLIPKTEALTHLETVMPQRQMDLLTLTKQGHFRGRPKRVARVLHQLAQGLHLLDKAEMNHGDIKPENAVGDLNADGELENVSLIDFGFSTELSPDTPLPKRGSRGYLAPEVVLGRDGIRPKGHEAGIRADTYSLAMLGWCLLKNRTPHQPHIWRQAQLSRNRAEGCLALTYTDLFFLLEIDTLREAESNYGNLGRLLHRMSNPDPLARPTVDVVIQTLQTYIGRNKAKPTQCTLV